MKPDDITIKQGIVIFDSSKIPMHIVCNGFVMKDVILDVLKKYQAERVLDDCDIEDLASDIEEQFVIKLGFKQGNVDADNR